MVYRITILATASMALSLTFAEDACAERTAEVQQRMQAVQARIDAVAARIARLEDFNAVADLQRTFGYYFDKGLWDEVADLFTQDATLEVGLQGAHVGRDSIRAYLYGLNDGHYGLHHGQLNNHFQLQPVITFAEDGTRAHGRWQALIQTGQFDEDGHGGEWGAGVYENEYVLEDGVWKIARLHFFIEFHVPYDEGWTRASQEHSMGYGASAASPDRPRSIEYRPYPDFFVPPFHYANPGTQRLFEPVEPAADAQAPETLAVLENRVRDLELQVRRVQAVDEVENLMSMYGHFVDQSMQDAIADLFVEDATLEILGRGVYLGRDRTRTYMRRLGHTGPRSGALFNHMQLQPVVSVSPDGRTAQVRARLMVQFSVHEQSGQWGEGIYENTFVRENGRWKYRNLLAFQTFYTTYEQGWAQWASPIFAPYADFPPDQPQTVDYDPYPEVFVPPFHYPHPVTGRPVPSLE